MRGLIIGGTGTISTPITECLVARGDDLTVFNRGNHPVKGVRVITGDRYKLDEFEGKIHDAGEFDYVIDMISFSSEHIKSSIRALKGRTRQYIFTSTVDVYTKPAPVYPIKEGFETKPDPLFEYAWQKAECEAVLKQAQENGDFNITILRPAATYCEYSWPIPLVGDGPHIFRRIKEGKPILVLGDGTSIWVSASSRDVAPVFCAAAGNPETYGEAYHVAGEEWMTWKEYYKTVARVMNAPEPNFVGIPTELLFRAAPKEAAWCKYNFCFNNIFDNTKAKRVLGYQYTVSWEDGVHAMLKKHQEMGTIGSCRHPEIYDKLIDSIEKLGSRLVSEM